MQGQRDDLFKVGSGAKERNPMLIRCCAAGVACLHGPTELIRRLRRRGCGILNLRSRGAMSESDEEIYEVQRIVSIQRRSETLRQMPWEMEISHTREREREIERKPQKNKQNQGTISKHKKQL